MEKTDILIVGSGIIGCATAYQASLDFPDKTIAVVEKNTTAGLEASGRNSGVLHSGFHHPTGSLKEQLANKGSKMAKEYAKANDIPLLECGMLIIVPKISGFSNIFRNLGLLRTLYGNSARQRLKFSLMTSAKIKKIEPNIKAMAGIFLPEVAVIDQALYLKSLLTNASSRGVKFFFKTTAVKMEIIKNDSVYGTGFMVNSHFFAKSIINCAGVHADTIANSITQTNYRQYSVRGEYYEITKNNALVSRLVYPAVSPDHKGKGIHFSPRPDSSLFLGPSFKAVNDKEDYSNDKTPAESFLGAVQSFAPDLRLGDLEWAYSGIRAKLDSDKDSDFIIRLDLQNPPMVNNIGIDSPGLSASLAIAQMNCELLKTFFKS